MSATMIVEASSPLASMQPPSFYGYHGFRTHAPPLLAPYGQKSFGSNNFNFKDLSMKRSHSDYFSMPPAVRGSSPTASLAADLSQNMHIDQSPQLPTPRRSLFVASTLGQRPMVTTPPVPSSPVADSDGMDMSPLPHKAPFCTTIEAQLLSPSPEKKSLTTSPVDMEQSSQTSSTTQELPALLPPTERRRSGTLRPSLARAKGFSTNSIPQRQTLVTQLPPFQFGSGVGPRSAPPSTLALSEIFEESPVQDRATARLSAPVMPAPRMRPSFALGNAGRNGSPGHIRKSSNPLIRPRKQFRRSLSMFEHPGDVMNQDQDTPPVPALPLIQDVDVAHVPHLPHFTTDNQTCDLPRITKDTMIDILDGKYDHMYAKRVVIDCRFEYEYKGGHIDGAVNFNDKEQLAAQLFDLERTSKALLIFHCEYSAHRAPLMAKFIRSKDRTVNAESYPNLTYPEAYILDGGYSSFFKQHSMRCFPQNYVEMDAQEHVHACERGLGKVKQRAKLVRAQTFAFGQNSPSYDSSPTVMGQLSRHDDGEMDLDFTPAPARSGFDFGRGRPARIISY